MDAHDATPMGEALVRTVLGNLTDAQDWTQLEIHSGCIMNDTPLPRVLISGLPPKRIYMHPDEQIESIAAEKNGVPLPSQSPEFEWVLPVSFAESWSLRKFAAIFDSISPLPREDVAIDGHPCAKWRDSLRGKRLLLAIVHNDSTVIYYIVHDGVVKPRPN